MFWDGLFCFYWLARRTLLVFLGREGSSICITKRFEQQVLFWMFTYFVCLFTFFVFVFSSLFKTFKELEKRLMHCEYHHCISASQSSEWFMICSNIFFYLEQNQFTFGAQVWILYIQYPVLFYRNSILILSRSFLTFPACF